MRKILGRKFFERSALVAAEELVGKFLVRKIGKKETAAMIIETEAYDGHEDRASHASKGKTARNTPMFGEAGRLYVYFVYGMHEMLNVVTGPRDYPAAVLIRGIEGASGPGKLTKRLKITRKLNNKPAAPESGLWFENRGVKIKKSGIRRLPRVGVSYAGPVWSKKKYRFVLR